MPAPVAATLGVLETKPRRLQCRGHFQPVTRQKTPASDEMLANVFSIRDANKVIFWTVTKLLFGRLHRRIRSNEAPAQRGGFLLGE